MSTKIPKGEGEPHRPETASPPSGGADGIGDDLPAERVVALQRLVARFLSTDPRASISEPATRARILATLLIEAAEVFDQPTPGLGPDLARAVRIRAGSRINEAWRAFHGLTLDRHRRLALVEAVAFAAGEVKSERVPREAAVVVARTVFAIHFPELAEMLDARLLEEAVMSWRTEPGAPRKSRAGSKWNVIRALMTDAELVAQNHPRFPASFGRASATSLKREWQKHGGDDESTAPKITD